MIQAAEMPFRPAVDMLPMATIAPSDEMDQESSLAQSRCRQSRAANAGWATTTVAGLRFAIRQAGADHPPRPSR